ncbi:hypothetical protein A9X00_07940 [Mycobacterium sp. 1245805.9]|nr:hypothetical protein A9X00_07940 [Mycobacterium sp. 1245805.9]
MDPGRFHSGRWFLLIEGALVSAFGIAGLISAALHPHAGPTGAPVLGLMTTPAHSGLLLAFGVMAIAAVARRRTAVAVTALSAVAYLMLLFFSSVATARRVPTPMGFHAADVLLHGVLAAVNLALLMWLIPDELGDEVWAPRRRRRDRDKRRPPPPDEVTARVPAPAAPAQESDTQPGPPQTADFEQSSNLETNELFTLDAEKPTPVKHSAARVSDRALPRRALLAAAVLAAVVGIVIWMRRRNDSQQS